MSLVEILVALVTTCVALAVLARRANVPYAVALMIGGIALAFIPAMPVVELDPHIALSIFLPPLLQASAARTDWAAFRSELRPILLLAIGAVLFTAAAVAATAHALIDGLSWGACLALGAIVAPPDAVAAASVLRSTRIPRRLVTIIEGESLINDASSLILYRLAVGANVAGSVTVAEAGTALVASSVGGTLIGFAVGRLVISLRRFLDDTMLEIAAMVLAGFASYFAAELAHTSGVLAAVACGSVIGHFQHEALSARTRVTATGVWTFIDFVLTSLVFILIGLQLRGVLERLHPYSVATLAVVALAVSAALILSRFAWVFGTAAMARIAAWRGIPGGGREPAAHLTVVAWAGMRGVVSLAAALALPIDFPARDLLVFLAFCAILATLVLQGTTLGWVIVRLGVTEPAADPVERREASVRRAAAMAALRHIEQRLYDGRRLGLPDADMLDEYRRRAAHAEALAAGEELAGRRRLARLRLELEATQAARRAVLDRAALLDGEMLQAIEEEFDFEEARVRRALAET